jgi:hypothetical protein
VRVGLVHGVGHATQRSSGCRGRTGAAHPPSFIESCMCSASLEYFYGSGCKLCGQPWFGGEVGGEEELAAAGRTLTSGTRPRSAVSAPLGTRLAGVGRRALDDIGGGQRPDAKSRWIWMYATLDHFLAPPFRAGLARRRRSPARECALPRAVGPLARKSLPRARRAAPHLTRKPSSRSLRKCSSRTLVRWSVRSACRRSARGCP